MRRTSARVQTTYGALDAVDLAQAYSFDPLYSSGNYGSGTTVALVEMSGAGYSPTDIGQFATCYGITLGNQQVTQRTVAGGGATGGGTVEAELDIETVLSLAPKANIEVYEGGPTADMYSVFNSDRQRRHSEDRERQLDERLRGVRRARPTRIPRTRSSRRRPSRASRSSSHRGTRAPKVATSTAW